MKSIFHLTVFCFLTIFFAVACEEADSITGDTSNTSGVWDTTGVWDSTGISSDDLRLDMRDLLIQFDPISIGRSWSYCLTDSGSTPSVEYCYRRNEDFVERGRVISQSLRQSPTFETVRDAESTHLFHVYTDTGSFDSSATGEILQIWPFYCFLAANAGDTIRHRTYVANGDTLLSELVRVVQWHAEVELPDTTFEECYEVTIDTLEKRNGSCLHHYVVVDYAPGIGLVKRVDTWFVDGAVTRNKKQEYIPPKQWPWFFDIPTAPGEEGDAIKRYFPLTEGLIRDYSLDEERSSFSMHSYRRKSCQSRKLENGHYLYPVDVVVSRTDSTALDPEDTGLETYCYNGNVPLSYLGWNNWEPFEEFFRFPDVYVGQVQLDSTGGDYYHQVTVLDLNATVTVTAGVFDSVYVVENRVNWSEDHGTADTVYYAPWVGLIKRTSRSWQSSEVDYRSLRELVWFSGENQ